MAKDPLQRSRVRARRWTRWVFAVGLAREQSFPEAVDSSCDVGVDGGRSVRSSDVTVSAKWTSGRVSRKHKKAVVKEGRRGRQTVWLWECDWVLSWSLPDGRHGSR